MTAGIGTDLMALRFQPLDGWNTPAYPTKLAVAADPQLLFRHLPPVWLRRPELRRALGLLAGAGLLLNSGCVTRNVPAITGLAAFYPPLSEAEALRIIRTELAARGVEAVVENVTLTGVHLADWKGAAVPFVTDLGDPGGKWYIEYLSSPELSQYPIPEDGWVTGARVRAEVAMQVPNEHVGVFYQDHTHPQGARAALQQQVREFLDWLAAQGVI